MQIYRAWRRKDWTISSHRYVGAWIDAIREATDPGRLARGRVYYRTGRVIETRVDKGEIRGKVEGSRHTPYEVIIRVRPYGESEWKAAASLASSHPAWSNLVSAGLASLDVGSSGVGASGLAKADYSSPALDSASRAPQGFDADFDAVEAFAAAEALAELDRRWVQLGLCTFAQQLERSMDVQCSCPDYRDLCKHAVALWYAFGEQLSVDPTVFVTLFGGSAVVFGGSAAVTGGPATVSGGPAMVSGGVAMFSGGPRTASSGQATVSGGPRTASSGQATVSGGPATAWRGARGGTGPRAGTSPLGEGETGLPLVLLPASAEHNLQDRGIEESIDRYWRPIREIRLAEEPPEPSGDFEWPIDDLSELPLCDHEEVAQVLEQMYTEIRQRAMQIRRSITPGERQS